TGADVLALADGVVVRSRNGGVSGYHQEITVKYDVRHVSRFVDYVWVLYGHMLKDSLLPVGTVFKRGRRLGKCGTVADAMGTIPHPHIQVWIAEAHAMGYANSKAIDPRHIRAVLEPVVVPEHVVPEKPPAPEPLTPAERPPKAPPARPKRSRLPDPTDGVRLSPNFHEGPPAGGWQGVTVHMMQDHFSVGVGWLLSRAAGASTHFSVREDGYIEQMVWENDRAWHARTSGMYYLGIEHDGTGTGAWVPHANHPNRRWVPKKFKTARDAAELHPDDRMLDRSANLTAYLLNKYGLAIQHDYTRPPRRDTISVVAGHDQMAGNNHVDPQDQFPWKAYMRRVEDYAYGRRKPHRGKYAV
ncbi:MAG: N-acetylmuramoyl-L-alanine amidase, partial [Actinomycetes bacterium]